jgi:NAD(P)-dependent dehydrogenase (short-subunit alcohol dehydrogenase family)
VRQKTVLVVGVSGLIGHAAAERFALDPGWRVVGVSRRVPTDLPGVTLQSVDLLDRSTCLAKIGSMPEVTHLVYAAVDEAPGLVAGWFDQRSISRNETMLRNVLDGLEAATAALEHVTLLQGCRCASATHSDLTATSISPRRNSWRNDVDEVRDGPSRSFVRPSSTGVRSGPI